MMDCFSLCVARYCLQSSKQDLLKMQAALSCQCSRL